MPVMQWVNGIVQTTSVNAQTSTDTAFTPSSVTGFPTVPQFTLLNIRTGELVLVTALAATWTITRGYGGSAAAAINAGDALQYSVTREMLLGGMVVKLEDILLAGSQANLTFPSGLAGSINFTTLVPVPRSLLIHAVARSDRAGSGGDFIRLRFNGDAGNNYGAARGYTTGTFGGDTAFATSGIRIAEITAATATANVPGAAHITIFDWASTAWTKMVVAQSVYNVNEVPEFLGGSWRVTTAINSILLYPETGPNFVANSRFTLYGMP